MITKVKTKMEAGIRHLCYKDGLDRMVGNEVLLYPDGRIAIRRRWILGKGKKYGDGKGGLIQEYGSILTGVSRMTLHDGEKIRIEFDENGNTKKVSKNK